MSFGWFFIMAYQLDFTAHVSMITCIAMGTIFGLGMAFYLPIRCVAVLMLPALCSSKGRTLLLAYAFLLVMTHPVQNFRLVCACLPLILLQIQNIHTHTYWKNTSRAVPLKWCSHQIPAGLEILRNTP